MTKAEADETFHRWAEEWEELRAVGNVEWHRNEASSTHDDCDRNYHLAMVARAQHDFDTAWRLLHVARDLAAQQLQMGICYIITLSMAQQAHFEGKKGQSLDLMCEVAYLGRNGARNGPPVWDPPRPGEHIPILAPAIATWLKEWAVEVGLDPEQLGAQYIDHNRSVAFPTRPPITPEIAWQEQRPIIQEAWTLLPPGTKEGTTQLPNSSQKW